MEPGRVARDRWELWLKVVDHRLLPPLTELEASIARRRRRADRLWHELLAPAFALAFPTFVVDEPDPLQRVMRDELQLVASAAYGLADRIYRLHGNDEGGAARASTAATWMALAAAVIDQLVDDRLVDPAVISQHLNPTAFLAAVFSRGPIPAVPGQPFATILIEQAVTAMRVCIGSGRQPVIAGELEICLRHMIDGQLASPELRIALTSNLDNVEATLHRVNSLTVWVAAYLGLFVDDLPPASVLRDVRDATTRVGEIGWMLDALSDIHVDLEAGVWSLVWLELARTTGLDAAWLRDRQRDPSRAIAALAATDVRDRLLARIGLAIEAIERAPLSGAAALAAFCRYMVWSFLVARPP